MYITIKGTGFPDDTVHRLVLFLSYAAEATCSFGEKSYKVRLIDGNSNLTVTDPVVLTRFKAEHPILYEPGDTVAIDTSDGSFAKNVRKSFYGQPVIVDGKAYDLTMSADGTKLLVKSSPVPVGRVRGTAAQWSVELVGDKYVSRASSGPDHEVEVLADQYIVASYKMHPQANIATYLSARIDPVRVKYRSIEVAGGHVAELGHIGQSLKAVVETRDVNREITFSLRFTDLDGYAVDIVRIASGQEPEPPKIKVVDEKGVIVHEATLEDGFTFWCSWRPPKKLKGTFAIKLTYDTKPFETKLEEGTLRLE